MKSSFVVIEGLDGSGKTTLLNRLSTTLESGGQKVIAFKEPGEDNAIGKAFRAMSRRGSRLPTLASAYLLAAERLWRSQQVVQWLHEGCLVIADRYYLSGMVYCGAEGLSFKEFSDIHEKVLQPHLYIYLDISLELALRRKGLARDKWEEKDILRRAIQLYPQACKYIQETGKSHVCLVNANQTSSDVLKEALLCLSQSQLI